MMVKGTFQVTNTARRAKLLGLCWGDRESCSRPAPSCWPRRPGSPGWMRLADRLSRWRAPRAGSDHRSKITKHRR